MGLLNKSRFPASLLVMMLTAHPATAATSGSTTITADIIDGICQVSFSTNTLTFPTKSSAQFAGGTAQVLPLEVNMNCVGMSGLTPLLKVTGDSVGVKDKNLFRSASSTASYAAFMLKKGTLTDPANFYNAAGTVAPGDVIAIGKDDGDSVEYFTVGLVQGAGDPPLGNGTVNASINFAFVYP